MNQRTRRDQILGVTRDLVVNFVAYDRKGDEDLPLGEIEKAVETGEVSIDEIVAAFRASLEHELRVK